MAQDRYSDGSREVQNFFHSLQMVSGSFNTLADVLIRSLDLMKEDPVNKVIASALRHDDAVVFGTDDFREASDLREKMRENGLYFTATAAYKDQVYVVVPKGDLERASEVVNDFYDSKSQGLFTPEYLNYYAGGDVMEIKGLNETEASLMAERSAKMHIPISVDGPSDGKYRIRFAQKDLDKMDRVRLDSSVALCGPAGSLYREHIAWKNEYSKAVLNTVISGKFPDGKTVPEGCAVVGTDGKRAEVTKQYIKLWESGSCKSFSRNAGAEAAAKNAEEISRFVKSMENPVFLSGREYNIQKSLDTDKREEFFSDKEHAGFLLPRELYKKTLAQNASQGMAPDGSAFHNGDRIMDGRGNVAEIREDGIRVTEAGKGTYVLGEKAYGELAQKIEEMKAPVYLTSAKAEELGQEEDRNSFLRREEISQREFVHGRPRLSDRDMQLIAKANAMQHEVEVRLKHDGIETPVSEKLSYDDAAQIFGLTSAENEEFHSILSQSVSVEAEEDRIGETVELVEEHYGITEPEETLIPISREIESESIFEDRNMDISFGNDSAQLEFDLDEF